jgi:hypothetical protein
MTLDDRLAKPAVADRADGNGRASRLTRWAWLMVPSLLASYVLANLLGTLMLGVLDVPEGALLGTAGVLGGLAAVLVLVITVAPPAAGVMLARAARRVSAGGRTGGSAGVALAVNGALLLWLLVTQSAQLVIG